MPPRTPLMAAFALTSFLTALIWCCALVAPHLALVTALSGTYQQLARDEAGPALEQVLWHLDQHNLTSDTGPDEVKPLRLALLRARESLEVFAYAYPGSTCTPGRHMHSALARGSSKECADPWARLVKDLGDGYKLIGTFQDLAHSGVHYRKRDVKRALKPCLDWQDRIQRHRRKYDYEQFVCLPLDSMVQHGHMNRHFWGGCKDVQPSCDLSGGENLVLLVRDCQLRTMRDLYGQVCSLQHVYKEKLHLPFHEFRKMARSALKVLELFPQLLPNSSHITAADSAAATATRKLAGHTLGSWDEGWDEGWDEYWDADEPPVLQLAMKDAMVAKRPKLPSECTCEHSTLPCQPTACEPQAARITLQALFRCLGKVNDQVFAYEFYKKHKDTTRAQRAQHDSDRMWADLKHWMEGVRMHRVLRCLADSLHDW